MDNPELQKITRRLCDIFSRNTLPDKNHYMCLMEKTANTLLYEDSDIRPVDEMGLPGGLIFLGTHKETIIIPDIHGRMNLIISILFHRNEYGETVLERLGDDRLQVVCVGDGMHGESRAARRWLSAKQEYLKGYKRHNHIDIEMIESMGVMEMVMVMKSSFPRSFHYLKGNHDNILNEQGNGNYPFMKFALESLMVTQYLETFYGLDFLKIFGSLEKNLPLLAVGEQFLVSHSEPACFFNFFKILNYRKYPEVVEGLTWTDDNYAEDWSVQAMIDEYIDPSKGKDALYFGGHRPVKDLFNIRARGRYIQIHNPNKLIVANIKPYREINLRGDVIEIDDISHEFYRKVI